MYNFVAISYNFLIKPFNIYRKAMKNIKFGFLSVFALSCMMFFSSCEDLCKDVECVQGECVEGDCVCDQGYEGTLCDTKMTDKFVGTYTVNENCDTGTYTYSTTITASSTTIDKIVVNNLYDSGDNLDATVDGSNATIASQTFNGLTYSGTGSMNTDATSLTLTYVVSDGSATDNCTAVLAKQ